MFSSLCFRTSFKYVYLINIIYFFYAFYTTLLCLKSSSKRCGVPLGKLGEVGERRRGPRADECSHVSRDREEGHWSRHAETDQPGCHRALLLNGPLQGPFKGLPGPQGIFLPGFYRFCTQVYKFHEHKERSEIIALKLVYKHLVPNTMMRNSFMNTKHSQLEWPWSLYTRIWCPTK